MDKETLVDRLRKRAAIRRYATDRKSVRENQPDRIADLLEEAANEIEQHQCGNSNYWCPACYTDIVDPQYRINIVNGKVLD